MSLWAAYVIGKWRGGTPLATRMLAASSEPRAALPTMDTIEDVVDTVRTLRYATQSLLELDGYPAPEVVWARHLAGKPAGDCQAIASLAAALIARLVGAERIHEVYLGAMCADVPGRLLPVGHAVALYRRMTRDGLRWGALSHSGRHGAHESPQAALLAAAPRGTRRLLAWARFELRTGNLIEAREP